MIHKDHREDENKKSGRQKIRKRGESEKESNTRSKLEKKAGYAVLAMKAVDNLAERMPAHEIVQGKF